MNTSPSVIILVADGARPDTLSAAMHAGTLPACARLRAEGAYHTVTTVFPSVTGPAYVPFLSGRYPGQAGLPGLRWYDRTHATCRWPGHARSYVGVEMARIDQDLDAGVPTLFQLAPSSLGALSMIGRGLPARQRLERGARFAARAAFTHFRGDVRGWLAIDRDMGETLVRRVREERPAFTFAAFPSIDKTSHADGHAAPRVWEALRIVDTVAAQLRADAERAGRWAQTHLWIVSDHGHSPVEHHDDLADALRGAGMRVVAHPRVFTTRPDVAVMVSGNAMAHLYLAMDHRARLFWPTLETRRIGATTSDGNALVTMLLDRASVDLVILPTSHTTCRIATRARGAAMLTWEGGRFTYHPETGDPLGIGAQEDLSEADAHARTLETEYPDALVQIAALCSAPRSGDIILSASRQWDYRAKYEPIPHRSAHGALHRDHMLVPLLTNHPTSTTPRRTVDIMPSAAAILGLSVASVDGRSFMDSARGSPG